MEYCDQFVCLSVCLCVPVCLSVREHISGTTAPIFTRFFVQVPCGSGSILLWWRCDTLCTSGFMHDMFGRSRPYGDACLPLAALRYRGEVWCLWMPCCKSASLATYSANLSLIVRIDLTFLTWRHHCHHHHPRRHHFHHLIRSKWQ